MAEKWKHIEEKWTIKDIGAPLLDTLARGLYDSLEVLREYAQNAIDSYVDYQKLTGDAPLKTVQVWVDTDNASLKIHDNGVGMNRDDVLKAKSIAVSPKLKRPEEFVGFRGIGIWSGLAACDRIEIVTTKVGDPFEYKLEIDCAEIVQHVEDPISVDELLKDRFRIFERAAAAEEHSTTVKLVNVHKERYGQLLDKAAIRKYAAEVLPVPFDPDWPDHEALETALHEVPWTQIWDLTVDGEPVYRRFPATQIKKPTVEKIVIEDGGKKHEIATAWIAETSREGSRKVLEPDTARGEVAGFAVRLKNFAIGQRNLYADDTVEDKENLGWFVGEIYVTDHDLRPDSNRRALQPSDKSAKAIAALREFYSRIATRARGWSAEITIKDARRQIESAVTESSDWLGVSSTHSKVKEGKASPKGTASERTAALVAMWQAALDAWSKIEDLQRKASTTKENGSNSNREVATRASVRKPHVKQYITDAEGFLQRLRKMLQENAPDVIEKASQARPTKGTKTRAKRTRKRRTSAGTGGGSSSDDGTASTGLVDLETARDAFLAAVAAVVGENSAAFRKISARLDEELRRRGISVKAA